jgi:hypothetical protein
MQDTKMSISSKRLWFIASQIETIQKTDHLQHRPIRKNIIMMWTDYSQDKWKQSIN